MHEDKQGHRLRLSAYASTIYSKYIMHCTHTEATARHRDTVVADLLLFCLIENKGPGFLDKAKLTKMKSR